MFAGRYNNAIETIKAYLNHPKADWDEERSASMRFIGKCYDALGDYSEAKRWLLRAVAETPHIRDPYTELAFLSYSHEYWPALYFAVTSALQITEKNILGYPNDPRGWTYEIYDLGAIACYNIGLNKQALEYAEKAFEMSPDDNRLKQNFDIIKSLI